jgi:hypothetical protein
MTATQASNQELVGAIAVDVLAGKGWCDDEPDCELIAALRCLFGASPVCQLEVEFNGEVLHDMLRWPPRPIPRRRPLRAGAPGAAGADRLDLEVRL